MTDSAPLKSPGVPFPPPFLFAGGLAAGWLLERTHPLPFTAHGDALHTLGTMLVVAGMGLSVWGIITFRLARTSIIPSRPASRLVENGPYRFTRNPMYTGLTLAYLGVAAMMNSAWPLLALPVVLALLVRLVVRREEAYLQDAFGEEYAAYRGRVRRWL